MRQQLDLYGNAPRTPDQILEAACLEREPVVITAAFSGGDDSLAALHIAAQFASRHGYRFEVLHLDTGIGIPDTQQYVVNHCAAYGYELHIYKASENKFADGTPDPKVYEELVLHMWGGFPGAPMHGKVYTDLKQRSIERYKRERWEGQRIILATGLRRAESDRRKNKPEYDHRGTTTWTNPVIHWEHADLLQFFAEHGIERNPVSVLLGHSGECECGAGSTSRGKEKLQQIRKHYPAFAARIDRLAEEAARRGLCAKWGGYKSHMPVVHDDQMDLFGLCSSCADKAALETDPILTIGVDDQW